MDERVHASEAHAFLAGHPEIEVIDNRLLESVHTELMPVDVWFNTTFEFIREDLGFPHVTRAVAMGMKEVINVFINILLGGSKGIGFDAVPWTAVAAIAFILGHALNGWRLSMLAGGTVCFFVVFGLWKYAMQTLGLCVSFMALSVDHLITRWARERRQLLGLA